MTRSWTNFGALLTVALGVLTAPPAGAASLQQVSNWGATGVPADVSMFVYVPDKVAANPPVLTLIHYCGGTAAAVFGQAQGGGIVKAADQYGFIMVVPSSGRCWDVVSDKTRTRDGGGDSAAIRQMVKYALTKYNGNADRVYSTGDSSGGMMTELLLALYPDVFKAGAAFAGMPAGCRGASESGTGGGYSGACAGGTVSHTPQEWGTIVRNMDPGYSGHRPRVQLFHGDADTIIKYPNFTEAIKEWSDVLSLPATPTTTTSSGIQLGTHQGKRQTWNNSCGYPVLDTFQSIGGDHGPSDALFLSQYVIPFLGLDKTGPLDPEIEKCGSGGAGGSGAGGAAGASGGGGARVGGNAGGGNAGAGSGNGGVCGILTGCSRGGAGSSSQGGNQSDGGRPDNGGSSAGGDLNAAGSSGQGVGSHGGDASGMAGSQGASTGATAGGGTINGSAGRTSSATAGKGGGVQSSRASDSAGSGGCGCATVGASSTQGLSLVALVLGLAAASVGRSRRSVRPPGTVS